MDLAVFCLLGDRNSECHLIPHYCYRNHLHQFFLFYYPCILHPLRTWVFLRNEVLVVVAGAPDRNSPPTRHKTPLHLYSHSTLSLSTSTYVLLSTPENFLILLGSRVSREETARTYELKIPFPKYQSIGTTLIFAEKEKEEKKSCSCEL